MPKGFYYVQQEDSYLFCNNQPTLRIDPLGLEAAEECGPCDKISVGYGTKQDSSWKYEIDGCSIPAIVTAPASLVLGRVVDKDNPTGWCSFYAVCASHDRCYQTCDNGTKSVKDKTACDAQIKASMLAACDKCVAGKAWLTVDLTRPALSPAGMKALCYEYAEAISAGLKTREAEAVYAGRQKQVCTRCCCPRAKKAPGF